MGGKKKSSQQKKKIPFVSVCTPTFNRRPFIKSMIACFNHQTYPKNMIEWIIIDDGTDKIEDLVADHPNVKYFRYEEKMTLGKKRNLLHDKSSGEILVYMDDDDYYPPTRISHAVNMLLTHPKALCAGSSELYIYFKHIQKMYQFGPYGPNHATAGTFAFKRELLNHCRYDETACLAEEKAFLKNYTVPFVQLEPRNSILVFSHIHNTFDKKKLLEGQSSKFVKPSDKTVEYFMQGSSKELISFYVDEIESLLVDYEPGRPEMKPDVIKQTEQMNKDRELHMQKMKEEFIKKQQQKQQDNMMNNKMNVRMGTNYINEPKIMMNHPNLGEIPLDTNKIVEIMNKLQNDLVDKNKQIADLQKVIEDYKINMEKMKENMRENMETKVELDKNELDRKTNKNGEETLVLI